MTSNQDIPGPLFHDRCAIQEAQHVEDPQVVFAKQLVRLARSAQVRNEVLPGVWPFLAHVRGGRHWTSCASHRAQGQGHLQ